MPTYFCRTPKGLLVNEQKVQLANAITARHSEATGAPTFFVQVIIDEDTGHNRFIGGSPAGQHIWINGDLRAGRTSQQIADLMTNICADTARITSLPKEDIWIYINNIQPDHMVEFGKILPLPGEESQWFDTLPEDVQQRLKALGITHSEFML